MKPVLFEVGGVDVTSYGLSHLLATVVAWWMIGRDLRRRRRDSGAAIVLALAGALGGLAGAKLYYVAEHAQSLTAQDFGGTGFTWYGGFIGGAVGVAIASRRTELPLSLVAAVIAAPLAVAYGIGRIGCLLAGDGTYGVASDLPWALSFPNGTVPTLERVHPTPAYEAIGALAVAGLLVRLRGRLSDRTLFGVFAVAMGSLRLLVEFVRRNGEVALGMTQPQLWSALLIAVGVIVGVAGLVRSSTPGRPHAEGSAAAAGSGPAVE